jgi:hypothetical protein
LYCLGIVLTLGKLGDGMAFKIDCIEEKDIL